MSEPPVALISLLIASAMIPHPWEGIARSGMVVTPAEFFGGVAFALTLFTNMWATCIIAVRAW